MKIKKTYNDLNFVNFILACESYKKKFNHGKQLFPSRSISWHSLHVPQRQRLLPRPSIIRAISL